MAKASNTVTFELRKDTIYLNVKSSQPPRPPRIFDTSKLSEARDRLRSGDVVAIPTETVYGLAASIESEAGLKKIFSLKERPFFDPLIVHVESFKSAQRLTTNWSPLVDFLTRTFWPGPFTVVVPKATQVNSLITSGLETVAIRMPAHPLALEIIKLCGAPLAAPSANKFGRTSPSRAEHVRSEFPGVDLVVIDGGPCEVGVESTVALVSDDTVKIFRPGAITREMIESALKKWSHPVTVETLESEASPGHLKHHYQPKIPLALLAGAWNTNTKSKIERELGASFKNPTELHLDSDPAIAARELYSEMRRLAESGADLLYVIRPQDASGLWSAVLDRLERAASVQT